MKRLAFLVLLGPLLSGCAAGWIAGGIGSCAGIMIVHDEIVNPIIKKEAQAETLKYLHIATPTPMPTATPGKDGW